MADKSVSPAFGNPAVVGLAGFGATTMLLQFNNLGLAGSGVVLCMALAFGGMAQLIAGLLEFRTGNNFGFCVFTTYGAFWLTIGSILMAKNLGVFNITTSDIGWTLVVFTLLTFIFFLGAIRMNGALAFTFLTLLVGFILLDVSHLGGPAFATTIAALDLLVCALSAWYMMANAILTPAGLSLPQGKPWVK